MSDDVLILVEFPNEPGLRPIGVMDEEEISEQVGKSKLAIHHALEAIRWIADQTASTLQNVHHQPDTVELEFGIEVGSEVGKLVAKANANFHISAKMVWHKPKAEPEDS